MNNEIRKFDFRGASLRTLTDEAGEPWFVLKDCMSILDLGNPTETVKMFDDDEFSTTEVIDSIGRRQQAYIISEPGLYRLVMRSRKPEAKEFQRWVTHKVLPQIRKTGGYIPTSESDSDEDIMARAVLVAQKTIKQKNQQIIEQQSRIDELQPKASAWDNFVDIDDAFSVRDSAKLLSNLGRTVGQTELFEWLDRHDWIFRENKHWSARQSRINAGHLMMVPSKSHGTHKDGTPFAFPPTVKVTRKGLALIARRFGEETLQLEYPKAGA
jgi:anti-repressor protein|nr:MAG TPA: repressor domain protein [Caudoviricetes sp.]